MTIAVYFLFRCFSIDVESVFCILMYMYSVHHKWLPALFIVKWQENAKDRHLWRTTIDNKEKYYARKCFSTRVKAERFLPCVLAQSYAECYSDVAILSACPSVCLSYSGMMPKRLNRSSKW